MSTSLFERIFAADRGDRVAVLFEHRQITCGELRDSVLRVARSLTARGVAPGDRVALLLADSPEFVASFLAVVSLGAIAVPINLALRSDDQVFILKDCTAGTAIAEASAAKTLFENSPAPSELKLIIAVSREDDQPLRELDGLTVQDFANAQDTLPDDLPFESFVAETDRDAFILYTSGSTGEPKGAVHTLADICYTNETYCRQVLKLREDDRVFSSSRLPFAYGLGNAFTFPLLNGCTTILCREKPTPAVIRHVLSTYRPTVFFGVPVVYRLLLEHHRTSPLDTSSLRLCVSAGEALPAHLGQEWEDTFGVPVLDGIGSTEMLHMFMSNHEGEVRYGSSGKLLQGYEARLVNHDGAAIPVGETGNLWIKGDSAASRYWKRPENSAATFVDGWVRTGDQYQRDQEGFWWHMGRSDDCFKASGQWVSPVEVEGVLIRSETIRTSAVVEGRDADRLACVCAFVVAADGCDAEDAEVAARALCEKALPRFKQPRRYIFVNELPYTATGKVQRFKLREQLRETEISSPGPSVQISMSDE